MVPSTVEVPYTTLIKGRIDIRTSDSGTWFILPPRRSRKVKNLTELIMLIYIFCFVSFVVIY